MNGDFPYPLMRFCKNPPAACFFYYHLEYKVIPSTKGHLRYTGRTSSQRPFYVHREPSNISSHKRNAFQQRAVVDWESSGIGWTKREKSSTGRAVLTFGQASIFWSCEMPSHETRSRLCRHTSFCLTEVEECDGHQLVRRDGKCYVRTHIWWH